MTGDSSFSTTQHHELSPDLNLHITIEEVSQNGENLLNEEGNELGNGCEELFEIDGDAKSDRYFDIESDGHEVVVDDEDDNEHLFGIEENSHGNDVAEPNQNDPYLDSKADLIGIFGEKLYPQPIVGIEFESYDEAYNFYNSYAREVGFAIRVKSSWTKRNSKEKRGAVLCCNCEGFKTVKEANSRRKETRTGCLAMIRLRLIDPSRWRIDEAKLDHNHLFDPERAQNSKSHKRTLDPGVKRKPESEIGVEVRTIKLYRSPHVDLTGYREETSYQQLKLKTGDSQIINSFFTSAQLKDPSFLYAMDFGDDGNLKNVFWIDSKSRAKYGYFGDVVSFDTTCLSYNYGVPLVEFSGVNHHGQSVLFGCGFLSEESVESYIWLFRAWLTCLLGRPPQTILTKQSKEIQAAIAEVFPRAHHRLCLSSIVQSVLDGLRGLRDFEAFRTVFLRTVYDSLKVEDFESAWEDMVRRFGVTDCDDLEWLQFLYEDRERWAPVYSKDTFFAGMSSFQRDEPTSSFFLGQVHKNTSLQEFFNVHDSTLEDSRRREAIDDLESRDDSRVVPPRTRSFYELQLSQLYTKEIFEKFQDEVVSMSRNFDVTQIHVDSSVSTYTVKECDNGFEVMFDKAGSEVRCICGCFNFKGYLCRHALCILSYNGVEEIPFQYILSRWRKDFRRLYVPDLGSNSVDITNPVQWFDHLYRRAMQVVGEGVSSQEHYMVAWQAFKESLNKIRLVADKLS